MNQRMFIAGASLFALVTALGTPAIAQSVDAAAAPANAGIDDIVVTAQKRSENVQQVPIAISAINEKFLQSRNITSIDAIGSLAPNVKIERMPSNRTGSQVSIRGSVTINPAITWEPAVGIYLDGVYIAKAQGSIFDVADLERVEILRGPQGTLYGRNTLAGAVSLIVKKPSGELGGSAELTYGNYDYMRARASIDLPKFGIFSVKLSGQVQKRDGYVKVATDANLPVAPVKDLANLNNQSGMVQIRAEPSDTLTVDYMFDYSRYRQRPDNGQLIHVNQNGGAGDIFDPNSPAYAFGGAFFPIDGYVRDGRQSKTTIDTPMFERSKIWGHSLTASLEIGDATLKSITGYRELRFSDYLDLDGSPFPVAATARFTDYHAFSQELQLTGTAFDNRLNYVFGLYYFSDNAKARNPQSYFGGSMTFASDYSSHTKAYAAYTQLDYKVTDEITLTGGLRYNHEKKDIARRFVVSPGTAGEIVAINAPYGLIPDATYNNLSPAFTVRYEPSRNVNLYARFARGFKSGGYNGETNIVDAPTTDCPSGYSELCNPYKPEKVDSYEVGIKTRLLDNSLQLNLAGFWDEHKDLQLSVFLGTGAAASVVRNAGKARIRGLELEAIVRPVDWFTFNASFALLDTKYKEFFDGGTNVANNRAFPHAPKYTASLGADARLLEGNWGQFNLIGDMSFVSPYYTFPYALRAPGASDQVARTSRSQGRTMVNVRANVSKIPLGGMDGEVSLWVRNLTKENNAQNFIDFGSSFGGLAVGYFPDPRTFGITAGVRF